MDRPTPQQLVQDRDFIVNLSKNSLPVIDVQHPLRRARVLEIMERQRVLAALEGRGGSTRRDLIDFAQNCCPGQIQVAANGQKAEWVADIVR